MTIATSLAVTFITWVGGSVGKILTGQVGFGTVLIMIMASIIAAQIGAKVRKSLNTKVLQRTFELIMAATAVSYGWISL